MELDADEERMVLQLHDLGQACPSGDAPLTMNPASASRVAVGVVDLEAMAMALGDLRLAVGRGRLRAGLKPARPEPEPHRAAHVDALLVGHQVDDRVRRVGVDLGRVGAVSPRTLRATSITAICSP